MSDRKAVIKNADMSEEMQQDAVDCATQALEKYNIEKDIAAYIKKVCEKYSAKPRKVKYFFRSIVTFAPRYSNMCRHPSLFSNHSGNRPFALPFAN